MAKPTAKSTVVQMRQYIRDNKLNKQPIRLGMKRAELIAHLRKMGHYNSQHDKQSAMPNPPLPKKKAPAPKKKAALFPATLSFRKESFKDLAEVEAMLEKEERPEAIKELKSLRTKGRRLETQYKRGWRERPGGPLPGDAGYKKA